jgi:hypothetical protein
VLASQKYVLHKILESNFCGGARHLKGKLESPLENARFLKAEIINYLLLLRRKK